MQHVILRVCLCENCSDRVTSVLHATSKEYSLPNLRNLRDYLSQPPPERPSASTEFAMNSSQNWEIFGYNNETRPEYPTPPSYFFERRDQMDSHSDFRSASDLSYYNVGTFKSTLYSLLNFL